MRGTAADMAAGALCAGRGDRPQNLPLATRYLNSSVQPGSRAVARPAARSCMGNRSCGPKALAEGLRRSAFRNSRGSICFKNRQNFSRLRRAPRKKNVRRNKPTFGKN